MAALNFPDQPSNGQEYSANGKTWQWDGISWKLKHVTSGATSFIGLSDTPSTFDNGKWLKAENGALVWTTAPSGGSGSDTTYSQSSVADGDNIKLRLTDSNNTNDDILITAGTGVDFDNITAGGFTINCTLTGGSGGIQNIVEDTTPQLGGNLDLNSKNINGTGQISYSGNLIIRTDDVSGVVQTSLKLGRVQNLDSFIVKGDGNVTTIGVIESTGFKKTGGTSSQFLKADGSVDTTTYLTSDANTTYTLPVAQNGNNVNLKLVPDGGSANSNNQTVQFVAGNDIELLTQGTSNSVVIKSTATAGANTTYAMSAEDGSTVDKKALRLTASNPTSTQEVEFEGGSNITLTKSGNTITITGSSGGGSGSDGNTTYGISVVDGSQNDQKLIRLSSADPAGTDDIIVEEGDNVSITKTGDKLTFASSSSIASATDVDYDGVTTPADNKILQWSNNKWRLETPDTAKTYTLSAQDGVSADRKLIRITDGTTNQDIEVKAGTGIGITRTGSTLELSNAGTLTNLLDTNLPNTIDNGKILVWNSTGGGGSGAWELGDDTDTTYLAFTGTSVGLVPASTAGETNKFLRSDGDWADAAAPTLDAVLGAGYQSTKSIEVGNIQCADLNVTSNGIVLNSDFSGSSPTNNCDIKVERGNSSDVSIRWNESTDKWQYTNDGTTFSDIGGSSSDANTTYDLSVPSGTTKIRLDPSDSSGNDDVEITGGDNVTVTRTSGTELNISSTDTNVFKDLTGTPSSYDAGKYLKSTANGTEWATVTSGITIQDEGTALSTAATILNFEGAGVTASGTGSTKTITIGSAGIAIQEEGNLLSTAATTLNFKGSKVTASGTGSTKEILIEVPNLNEVTNVNASTTNSIEVGNLTCATLNISGNTINLNSDLQGSNPSETMYLKVERGNSSDVSIRWNESSDKWQFTNDGSNYYDFLTSGGTTLPSYQSGKYLTNNGSSLSWDDPDNNYVTDASWNSSTGQLTLTRGGTSSLSNVTANISNLVTYLEANLNVSGGNPTIQTDTGNTMHNLVFVDNISNSQQQLKIDSATNSLCYNPWSNRLIGQDFQSFRMTSWSNDYGDYGQFLMSNGSSEWGWSQYVEQKSNGELLLKRTTTSKEGGHLQFQDASGNSSSYAIDVYRNSSSADDALRFIDQNTGTERFSVGPEGQWGIGHINRDFGDMGQVMISRGPNLSPVWGNHSGIAGSEAFATNAQGATADTANAEIDHIYSQLNAIGNDDTITTVAQLKTALLALVRN